MALQSIWYFTNLPETVTESIYTDLSETFSDESLLSQSFIIGKDKEGHLDNKAVNLNKRNSKHAWISTNHWISGFLWHYVLKANKENFLYDITNIDGQYMQYTVYNEGCFYGWHTDADISTWRTPQSINRGMEITDENINDYLAENVELTRKISGILQLSDSEDYEGGNVQIMGSNGHTYFIPRQRGSLILFDSRSMHRVQKITKGVRRSLVFWCVGPRWK